mmetsp:Transcript_733/g.1415  ORF Transcript_733/g.1415 Transcript_733/m.1415 type:complete len:96 (-) Transcript_733:155-442(-)|eukprot:CAMPEP_0181292496 /NCGR_PEP_ID=MMETSP1101-20121128/2536_1 /TAXON_ID=46948 /ORGANISM="Rhodomonas abbreviata, Strain Caron Lab Isolate" /LENGTH=95 /DNA_ID=CAMNT_0023396967 /DNA_START=136 /DNA_END=423 /DNA_ORIENTATION=+
MFDTILQFHQLYNWDDQDKADWESWKNSMHDGFCSGRHRHCHWGQFYGFWNDRFFGDTLGKVCNRLDETGCNGPPFDNFGWNYGPGYGHAAYYSH